MGCVGDDRELKVLKSAADAGAAVSNICCTHSCADLDRLQGRNALVDLVFSCDRIHFTTHYHSNHQPFNAIEDAPEDNFDVASLDNLVLLVSF